VISQQEKFKLIEVGNLELIDKVTEKLKFAKAIMKRDIPDANFRGKEYDSASQDNNEIEEEAKTNVNNGMPIMREYD